MTIRILTTVIAFVFSISFYAQKTNNEFVAFHKTNNGTELKLKYQFDNEGKRTMRVLYVKDASNNWVAAQKYEYIYDKDNRLAEIVYTEKEKNRNSWETKSQRMLHLYDNNGVLIATKQMETDNECYLLAREN